MVAHDALDDRSPRPVPGPWSCKTRRRSAPWGRRCRGRRRRRRSRGDPAAGGPSGRPVPPSLTASTALRTRFTRTCLMRSTSTRRSRGRGTPRREDASWASASGPAEPRTRRGMRWIARRRRQGAAAPPRGSRHEALRAADLRAEHLGRLAGAGGTSRLGRDARSMTREVQARPVERVAISCASPAARAPVAARRSFWRARRSSSRSFVTSTPRRHGPGRRLGLRALRGRVPPERRRLACAGPEVSASSRTARPSHASPPAARGFTGAARSAKRTSKTSIFGQVVPRVPRELLGLAVGHHQRSPAVGARASTTSAAC